MQSNTDAIETRAELEAWGLATRNDRYRVNIKEYTSTIAFGANAQISGDIPMFQQTGTGTSAYNTHTFPRNETAVKVLGIRASHSLQLLSSEVAFLTTSKQNAVFEEFTRLELNYGQVAKRISLPLSTFLTHSTSITGDGNATTFGKTNSVFNDRYWRFPKDSSLRIGAKQDALWSLNTQGVTYTTALADSVGANANIAPLPAGLTGVFYITVGLLVLEYADAKS